MDLMTEKNRRCETFLSVTFREKVSGAGIERIMKDVLSVIFKKNGAGDGKERMLRGFPVRHFKEN